MSSETDALRKRDEENYIKGGVGGSSSSSSAAAAVAAVPTTKGMDMSDGESSSSSSSSSATSEKKKSKRSKDKEERHKKRERKHHHHEGEDEEERKRKRERKEEKRERKRERKERKEKRKHRSGEGGEPEDEERAAARKKEKQERKREKELHKREKEGRDEKDRRHDDRDRDRRRDDRYDDRDRDRRRDDRYDDRDRDRRRDDRYDDRDRDRNHDDRNHDDRDRRREREKRRDERPDENDKKEKAAAVADNGKEEGGHTAKIDVVEAAVVQQKPENAAIVPIVPIPAKVDVADEKGSEKPVEEARKKVDDEDKERRDRRDDRERDRRDDRDRYRDRDRRDDRDRYRDRERERERERDRRDDRDRDRDRDRRDDRDRSKDDKKEGDGKRSRSPSSSQPKKKSNFDRDAAGNEVSIAGMASSDFASTLGGARVLLQARRVYVSNLPTSTRIDPKTLADFMNHVMQAHGLQMAPGECVSDVFMGTDGKFAIVEFRSPEEATKALTLDGIQLYSHSLRCARPTDFMMTGLTFLPSLTGKHPATAGLVGTDLGMPRVMGMITPMMMTPGQMMIPPPAPALPFNANANPMMPRPMFANVPYMAAAPGVLGGLAVPGLVATRSAMTNTRLARRLIFRNLPISELVSAKTLVDFINMTLKALGKTVKGGSCVVDCLRAGKGDFALVEFRTIMEAANAMMLNGMMFENKQVAVSRLDGYMDVPPEFLQRMVGTGVVGSLGDVSAVPENPVLTLEPTRILTLTNVLTMDDLLDKEELQDIIEDTQEKCEKDFGKVVAIFAPEPELIPFDISLRDHITKVYIEFFNTDGAVKAQRDLDKQLFGDREVSACFMHEDNFGILKSAYQMAKAALANAGKEPQQQQQPPQDVEEDMQLEQPVQ